MLLGELLIYRYGLITKQQRADALARQRECDYKRRLGDILLEMGLLSRSDLQQALDDQVHQRDPWQGAR